MQSGDDLRELIEGIEASKLRLQGLFGGVESDAMKALKIAEKALLGAGEQLKSVEEYYVRNDLLNSGALKNTTTSYKFFWFQAIVEIIMNRKKSNDDDLTIEFRELFIRMLTDAFVPTKVHRLSLGGVDQLAKFTDEVSSDFSELESGIGMGISPVPLTLIDKFETSDRIAGVCTQLKKNVPYAFLRPFAQRLGATIQGNIDTKLAQESLCNYSKEKYQDLPYKIDRKSEIITISPSFKKFILSYYDVINGFIKSELVTYLEKQNPLVPNISQKLDCLAGDRNLTSETKIWKSFEENGGKLKDISDLEGISFNDDDKLAIDHFIPWNFVAHNEIWNLSPMKSENNSRKSDKLLTGEKNILCFINQQWSLYNYLAEGNHKKYREQYIPILQGVSDESGFKVHLGNAIKQHQEIALSRGWERLS